MSATDRLIALLEQAGASNPAVRQVTGSLRHTPEVLADRFDHYQNLVDMVGAEQAACTEQTAALFFDDATTSSRAARANHEAAKAICRLCPILSPCRAYARADPTLEGIW